MRRWLFRRSMSRWDAIALAVAVATGLEHGVWPWLAVLVAGVAVSEVELWSR